MVRKHELNGFRKLEAYKVASNIQIRLFASLIDHSNTSAFE